MLRVTQQSDAESQQSDAQSQTQSDAQSQTTESCSENLSYGGQATRIGAVQPGEKKAPGRCEGCASCPFFCHSPPPTYFDYLLCLKSSSGAEIGTCRPGRNLQWGKV